jgi:hypothetical protein
MTLRPHPQVFHSRFANPTSTHSSRREIDRWSRSRRNMDNLQASNERRSLQSLLISPQVESYLVDATNPL